MSKCAQSWRVGGRLLTVSSSELKSASSSAFRLREGAGEDDTGDDGGAGQSRMRVGLGTPLGTRDEPGSMSTSTSTACAFAKPSLHARTRLRRVL